MASLVRIICDMKGQEEIYIMLKEGIEEGLLRLRAYIGKLVWLEKV